MNYSENFTHQHALGKSTWHIEWCTKYRYKAFKSEYHKNICIIALEEAAKKAKVVLLEREVEAEHLHLIAELPLTVAPIEAIRKLKSLSARIVFLAIPKLRLRYPRGHLWSRGKFALSVGNITLEKAKEYVKNQKAHHAKHFHIGILAPKLCGGVSPQAEGLPRGGGQYNKNVYIVLRVNKYMLKRGQVSIFAIVGLIIVILVALFFFGRNQMGWFVAPTMFLDEKSQPIQDNLKICMNKVVSESLDIFSKQGGDFSPTNYRLYQGRAVKYYCRNIINNDKCMNVMPPYSDLMTILNKRIDEGINNCVDKNLLKGGFGYEIIGGGLSNEVKTAGRTLVVESKYNITIIKGEVKQTLKPVVVKFDAPIAELYPVALDIVNSEARFGFFEQLFYMLGKRGQVIVNLDKPYPDKIYMIKLKDSKFEFWFAVEGERNLYG
jgi:putative transposase